MNRYEQVHLPSLLFKNADKCIQKCGVMPTKMRSHKCVEISEKGRAEGRRAGHFRVNRRYLSRCFFAAQYSISMSSLQLCIGFDQPCRREATREGQWCGHCYNRRRNSFRRQLREQLEKERQAKLFNIWTALLWRQYLARVPIYGKDRQ